MKKNVSGQVIGAQMVNASTGAAFTGSVTVYVTGNAGTQAIGSVGSGACTHEGNGFHTYAPAQAETNYDHVAFTFIGTGAVPVSVQVYPSFPQTVDNATNISAIKTQTDKLTFTVANVLDANTLRIGGTVQTARDIGASVLLSAGTGTGQLDFTSGVVKANVTQLLGTAWLAPGTAGTPDINVKLWNGLTTVALPLVPTTAGRTLDVSAGGEAGIDWANIGSPTTVVGLSGTTVKTATDVETDTQNIQSRLPAALVSGRIDASVGAVANDAITAAAIASDAGTEIGTAVWASTTRLLTAGTNIVLAKGTGVTGFNDLSAAAVNAEVDTAISDAALATAANLAVVAGYLDTEVAAIKAKTDNLPADPASASTLATSFSTVNGTLSTIDGRLDTEIPAIKQVTDKLHTMVEAASGSPGESRFTADALVNAPVSGAGAPTAATVASAVWAEVLPGAYAAGQAGQILGDNLNATVSSRATQASVDTVDGIVDAILLDTAEIGAAGAGLTALASASNLATVAGYIDTEVAAIKAKTDNLPASPAASGDIPSASAVADAVWDEALSGHTSGGTAGLALRDADLRGSRTVARGTVGTATTPSTTQFTASALSPAGAAADQFKGRIIAFDNDTATPELRGQLTDITASSAASLPLFTFTALTTAPSSGDTFSIL